MASEKKRETPSSTAQEKPDLASKVDSKKTAPDELDQMDALPEEKPLKQKMTVL